MSSYDKVLLQLRVKINEELYQENKISFEVFQYIQRLLIKRINSMD